MKLSELFKISTSKIPETYLVSAREIYEYFGLSVLDFEYDPEQGIVSFQFFADKKFQAHPGMVHGGIIATLCDTVMGTLGKIISLSENKVVFTAEMTIRYKKPMTIGNTYTVASSLLSNEGSKLQIKGTITGAEGFIAKSEGLFIQKPFSFDIPV